MFVTKLDSDLTHVIWSTYIGSSGTDIARSLMLAPNGALYLTGTTVSQDFPSTPGTSSPYLEPDGYGFSILGVTRRPFVLSFDAGGAGIGSSYVFPFEGDWQGTSDQGTPFYGVVEGRIGAVKPNLTLNAQGTDQLTDDSFIYYNPFMVRLDPETPRCRGKMRTS